MWMKVLGVPQTLATFDWFIRTVKERFPLTVQMAWEPMLGFGCDVEEGVSVSFHGKKYIRQLVDKFLPGESKPERSSSSRESIMQLPAEPLPPLGSPEDLALAPLQHECRALGGGLVAHSY